MLSMDAKGRKALAVIRECVARKRYLVLPHFVQRMDQRGFGWPDVLGVLDNPAGVRSDGTDEYDRPKWIIAGETYDGIALDVACVLDSDERGRITVFITIY